MPDVIGTALPESNPITCNAIARRFIIYLAFIPGVGTVLFFAYVNKIELPCIIFHDMPSIVLYADYILLPRSFNEINSISSSGIDRLSCLAIYSLTVSAFVGGIVSISAIYFVFLKRHQIITISFRNLLGNLMFIPVSLVFRSPDIQPGYHTILSNTFNQSGFYLIRETAWISLGYYGLIVTIATIVGSLNTKMGVGGYSG